MHILDAIGNTSLARLRKVVPTRCAEILVKLEWENPIGSVKDRMANAAIRIAEELGPDARVVTLMADSGLKYLSTDVYRRS